MGSSYQITGATEPEDMIKEIEYESDVATAMADPIIAEVLKEARSEGFTAADAAQLGTGGLKGRLLHDFVFEVAAAYLVKSLHITYQNAAADAVLRMLTGTHAQAT